MAEAGLGSLFSDVVRFVVWADPSLVIWFTYGLLNVFWSHGTKSEHLGLGLWWELILFPVYVCVCVGFFELSGADPRNQLLSPLVSKGLVAAD